MGGTQHVRGIWRGTVGRRRYGTRPREWTPVHDCCQRRDGEGRRFLPHDSEESAACADHCDGRIASPPLYLVDSAGIFLPLQEDVFPDTDDFGRIFRNNAVMSSMGIPQITAIMGMCVAGGAYLPVMTDTVLMTEGSGLFLAGPSLVQAAIGQKTGAEELGGAAMHAEISGTVDFKEPNDHLCLARLRSLVAKMGQRPAVEVFRRRDFDAASDVPKFCTRRCVCAAQSSTRRKQCLRYARNHRAHRGPQRIR